MRFLLLLLALVIPSYALADQCDDWLEPSFWSTATADGVEVCLETHKIEKENEFGFRPFEMAIPFTRDPQVIRVLIDHGADLERVFEPASQTAFLFVILLNGRPEIIDVFLESGTDLEQKSDGLSALHLLASIVGNEKLAKSLQSDLRLDSLPEYESNLNEFAFRPDSSLISQLVDAGADINEPTNALETPLHNAMHGRANPLLAKILIDRGADLNPTDADGHTPLHHGVMSAYDLDRIMLLLNAGGDPSIKDKEGKVAWDYIQGNEHLTDIQKDLLEPMLESTE